MSRLLLTPGLVARQLAGCDIRVFSGDLPWQSSQVLGPGCRVKGAELCAVGWIPDGEVPAGRADDEQSVV